MPRPCGLARVRHLAEDHVKALAVPGWGVESGTAGLSVERCGMGRASPPTIAAAPRAALGRHRHDAVVFDGYAAGRGPDRLAPCPDRSSRAWGMASSTGSTPRATTAIITPGIIGQPLRPMRSCAR